MPDNSHPGPLISVRGEALLEVEPEIARIVVHVQSRDTDRRTTLDQLTVRNRQALELVRSYGEAVEKLETSGMSVTPVVRSGRRDEKVLHYQGTARIQATVSDFTVLGELVTRLGDQEMTSISGPWWQLRPDSAVRRQARQQAVREAVTRAREYAEALGSELTGMLELADVGLSSTPSPPIPMAAGAIRTMSAPGGAPSAPPPIDLEPETQTVHAAVEARFTASSPKEL